MFLNTFIPVPPLCTPLKFESRLIIQTKNQSVKAQEGITPEPKVYWMGGAVIALTALLHIYFW
ncbi:MAG: hypothetical protein BWY83_01498 [bacterium ADurb.Bin478]|nr:MAG: hypothetical protein BWY83_01498 [bacterium ADurb.Bin478]